MYVVIRKFSRIRSVHDAARRAESGIGQLLKQSPGFRGYYVFDAGGGTGGSVTFFDSQSSADAANEKALNWIRASLADLIDGEPEIIAGEVLATVTPAANREFAGTEPAGEGRGEDWLPEQDSNLRPIG